MISFKRCSVERPEDAGLSQSGLVRSDGVLIVRSGTRRSSGWKMLLLKRKHRFGGKQETAGHTGSNGRCHRVR